MVKLLYILLFFFLDQIPVYYWFLDFINIDLPVEFALKILLSEIWYSIRDTKVSSFAFQHSVNLSNAFYGILTASFGTQNRIQSPFIDHNIKRVSWQVHINHIHLQKFHSFVLLVLFFHLLYYYWRIINIYLIFVSLLKQFFRKFGISAPNN